MPFKLQHQRVDAQAVPDLCLWPRKLVFILIFGLMGPVYRDGLRIVKIYIIDF
jgi:hypothetical protein